MNNNIRCEQSTRPSLDRYISLVSEDSHLNCLKHSSTKQKELFPIEITPSKPFQGLKDNLSQSKLGYNQIIQQQIRSAINGQYK